MFHREPTATSLNCINIASEAKLAVYFKKVLKKFTSANNHLWFLTQCAKRAVFPSFINVKCNNTSLSAQSAINAAKNVWLKQKIKRWYQTRYFLNLHQKVIHLRMANIFHPVLFEELDCKIREEIAFISHQQYLKQKRKLENLVKKAKTPTRTLTGEETSPKDPAPRIVNLSSTSLTQGEQDILEKGLSFAPTTKPTKKDIINLVLDTEFATTGKNPETQHACYKLLYKFNREYCSSHKKPFDISLINKLRQKLDKNNLIICKADKGNTVTILDKSDYIQKVENFLSENQLTKLKKDPTYMFQLELSQVLRSCTLLVDQSESFRYKSMNPEAPILYGLPKLHKPNIPIRPVVSYTTAPTYRLCKFLNTYIRELLEFQPKYGVKNSIELIHKIQNFEPQDRDMLISFDVCSLFTSIPVSELMKYIESLLANFDTTLSAEILSLLKVCIKQNYFGFNNVFYKQDDGLPMGSPLSPLLAEIYMDYFEQKIFNSNNTLTKNIKFWFRYVDDILCLWAGTSRQLDAFLNYINQINRKIKFTMEIENQSSINFLDLNISHKHNKFEFNIFRKPTQTNVIIPADSRHPENIKHAAFHSYIHRLINVPLSEANIQAELKYLRQVAKRNGYEPALIDKIYRKSSNRYIKKEIFSQSITPSENIYKKINFLGKTSYGIANELRSTNTIAAFYTQNTLKNLLGNNKLRDNNKLSKSGIYQISCNDCNHIYIGQTGRSFYTRFSEHMRSWRLQKTDSNVAKHMLQFNHTFGIENLKILHIEKKGQRLDLLESYELKKALSRKIQVMNDQRLLTQSSGIDILMKLFP